MADPRWIVLGLLIPDLPWILQRMLNMTPWFCPTEIRAYVVSMSTPLLCFVLSAAISLPFQHRSRVFAVLSFHCLLHLLLDSVQEKAGVGVLFFAPLNWTSYSWPIFSMDGWVSSLLTAAGAVTLLSPLWGGMQFPGVALSRPLRPKLVLATALLGFLYVGIPALWMHPVIDENVHDLKIWRGDQDRTGHRVHLDRVWFTPGTEPGTGFVESSVSLGPVPILGISIDERSLISTIATFQNETTLVASEITVHPKTRRSTYTLMGLIGVVWIWTLPLLPRPPFKPTSMGRNRQR